MKKPLLFFVLALVGFSLALGVFLFRTQRSSTLIESEENQFHLREQLEEKYCKGDEEPLDMMDCNQRIEAAQIRQFKDVVQREDDHLILSLKDGKTLVKGNSSFTDEVDTSPKDPEHLTEDADQVVQYFFLYYYKENGLYLIEVLYYEGTGFLLVQQDTGATYHLFSPPVFGPEKHQFATASMDLEAGYNPNGIQIWQKKGLQWTKSFEQVYTDFGVSNPHWDSKTHLSFQKYTWNGADGKVAKGELKLSFQNSQWKED
ncbi:MAG: hypothetical protein CL676_04825 [Bdellovibrionaceae bacterium]|nr:hypothetical protein [Pseudobdellovibrionaceae bacterium]|tara:strand:+ start:8282 stop:9058 length:777 start_codon:yes stop_codon:yes gene_type:complete